MSNPSDMHARARRTAAEEEQRIDAKIATAIRSFFKNGVPPGTYNSFQWDGTKIMGAGVASSGMIPVLFATSGASGSFAAGSFRPNYSTIAYDPFSAVTTGVGSWHFSAPKEHYYLFEVHARCDPNGFVWTQGDKMQLLLHWALPGGGTTSDKIDEFGAVATSTATDLNQGFHGTYVAQVALGGACYVTLENITGVNRGYGGDRISIYDLGF
jgi:hypothetical protein